MDLYHILSIRVYSFGLGDERMIWILTVFLYTGDNGNELVETKNFFELTECIAYSQQLIRDYKEEGYLLASCNPKE